MADNYGDDLRESLRQFKEHLALSSAELEPKPSSKSATGAVSAEQAPHSKGVTCFVSIPDRA